MPAPAVLSVVQQHANEAASLWTSRRDLSGAPHVRLFELVRCDDRLAAHLDGLSVAGEQGWPFCDSMLQDASPGVVFVSAVGAIEAKQHDRLDALFVLAEAVPDTRRGLLSAFGWVQPGQLRGMVARLLKSTKPLKRAAAIAACAMHRVDPGLATGPWLRDPDASVRARALRTAGELGRPEWLSTVTAAITDQDLDCGFWAAWSAVLLGDRHRALSTVTRAGLAAGEHRARAFRLALQATPAAKGHEVLQQLAADAAQIRWLIEGSGIVGDPTYVPWLIKQMADDKNARRAGEAFTLITGADLAQQQLERPRPENLESGPNENPEDVNVDMDPDEGLPFPDPERIQRWWDANGSRFQQGTCYFMGAPVTRAHCLGVLKDAFQRQRMLAARHLCLLNPGAPLFNTSAPARRQQKLLAQME